MLKSLLLAALFVAAQSEKPTESGVIVGSIAPPGSLTISEPLQVILLSPRYVELWENDLQKRLDSSWERNKPAFAQNKEFFMEISRMAYRESLQFIGNRIRRDLRETSVAFLQQSSNDGRFEFKNLPHGNYKVMAMGRVGGQEFIWQESVALSTSIPQFVELKTRIP